ncbi:hypothetical protein VTH06DRAFT_4675 [Thermothelomyces fergusii]
MPTPATCDSPPRYTLPFLERNDQDRRHAASSHARRQPWPLPLPLPLLRGRDAGSMRTQNVTIGVVVGLLQAVFLAGFFVFVWRYHRSIRIHRRGGRHRQRDSTASRSPVSRSGGAPAAAGAADGRGKGDSDG